jgi:putative addiction module killer protein
MPLKIETTETFDSWLSALKDERGKAKIAARIDRLRHGNAGDVAPVGNGVSELRIHFGPGYRVYFQLHGNELVLLLAGGDKSTQRSDIAAAKRLAAEIRKGRT